MLLDNIRAIRKAKGLTQIDMSEQLGLTKNNYGKVENGQVELTVKRLYQIADILGVNAVTLLGEDVGDSRKIAELENKVMELETKNAEQKAELDRANQTIEAFAVMITKPMEAISRAIAASKEQSESRDEQQILTADQKKTIESILEIFPESKVTKDESQ